MDIDMNEIRKHIEIYFNHYLPKYAVLEIRRKSYHPNDDHLYIVSARKDDGAYAVWTLWNEITQSLNHGHYDLPSIEDCEKIFEEYQNIQPYYAVYKCSQSLKIQLSIADSEEQARKLCEKLNWKYKDENGFVWNLDYNEVGNPASFIKKRRTKNV